MVDGSVQAGVDSDNYTLQFGYYGPGIYSYTVNELPGLKVPTLTCSFPSGTTNTMTLTLDIGPSHVP